MDVRTIWGIIDVCASLRTYVFEICTVSAILLPFSEFDRRFNSTITANRFLNPPSSRLHPRRSGKKHCFKYRICLVHPQRYLFRHFLPPKVNKSCLLHHILHLVPCEAMLLDSMSPGCIGQLALLELGELVQYTTAKFIVKFGQSCTRILIVHIVECIRAHIDAPGQPFDHLNEG